MPFDCTKLSTAGYFTGWKAATSTAITTYQALNSPTQAQTEGMLELEKEMLDASLCISTSIHTLSSASSSIADLNQQILKKTAELSQANEDISIAKDRVANVRHPERNTSNYEGWFPIDRPISVFSMIVILCITIFLGVFLILLALSFGGVDIIMYSKSFGMENNPFIAAIAQQFTVSFWILLIAFISVVVYFVKRT
jgi:peptidoglycan hydrolase-like protein with peptidoglycan-binding domain